MNGYVTLPPVSSGALEIDTLRKLVGKVSPVVLDIGAHDGGTTAMFVDLFPGATVYSFEPDPRAAAKFKARVNRDPRVKLFEHAIGAIDGEAEFHVSSGLPPDMTPENAAKHFPKGWDMSGSLRAPKTHTEVWPWCKFEQSVRVPVRRLDSWAKEQGIGAIDFIWADVQGAEGDLIAGAKATLAKARFFYTEYSNDEWYAGQPKLADIAHMLKGFSILRRYEMDVLFKNDAL
jgi:FkbM family methyltransferase